MKWDKEKIKEGFENFYKENGRLPTAPEVDNLDYLPSSRTIQRSFGGLQKIRKDLGYEDINLETLGQSKKIQSIIKKDLSGSFEKFYRENNRLPTITDIDKIDYFPSTGELDKRYKGIDIVRKTLGYDNTNYNKGSYRSALVKDINKRGRKTELFLEKILKDKFHEVFVHTEKIFDNSKIRVDFYIYNKTNNFGIDVFYTTTIKNLLKNINVKLDKYVNFKEELFFVVGNDIFNQEEIDLRVAQKDKKLPDNIKVINLNTFLNIINEKEHYNNPLI